VRRASPDVSKDRSSLLLGITIVIELLLVCVADASDELVLDISFVVFEDPMRESLFIFGFTELSHLFVVPPCQEADGRLLPLVSSSAISITTLLVDDFDCSPIFQSGVADILLQNRPRNEEALPTSSQWT
jgi:hypothetical protein